MQLHNAVGDGQAKSCSINGLFRGIAAAVLYKADKSALDHCLFGHVSAEPAHARLLKEMGKEALLNLGMQLGEASGAALAAGVVKAALACHNGMATFESAGVSNKE
jgi:nicotinate-nucleotide--dimethylbenzimidazole phosphoribosyltransferase